MKEERRIPLLSRLAGKASGRGLSRSEYLSAVAEDVEELLNTRAPCGNGDAADLVMGYGLADWSSAGRARGGPCRFGCAGAFRAAPEKDKGEPAWI